MIDKDKKLQEDLEVEEPAPSEEENPFEVFLDTAGDTLVGAVDVTGRTLHTAAAHVTDFTGDVVENVSTFIDDVTEESALKEWGDNFGEVGRSRAEEIEEHAEELEHDHNPTGI